MKEYIRKPVVIEKIKTIQLLEKNKELIIQSLSKILVKKHLNFFYYDDQNWTVNDNMRDKRFCKLGLILFMDNSSLRVQNGDYIIINEKGVVTKKEKDAFEKEFELVK